jgi:hypothetical protein
MALNGTREWILEWEVETVGRGGGRVAVAFHFSMGGEGTGRLDDRASGGRRMAALSSCFG